MYGVRNNWGHDSGAPFIFALHSDLPPNPNLVEPSFSCPSTANEGTTANHPLRLSGFRLAIAGL